MGSTSEQSPEQRQGATGERLARTDLSEKVDLSIEFRRGGHLWLSGRAFQAEGTAGAKAQRRQRERAGWLVAGAKEGRRLRWEVGQTVTGARQAVPGGRHKAFTARF